MRNGTVIRELKGHSKVVNCVLFSNDDKLIVSGSEDNLIKVWDR